MSEVPTFPEVARQVREVASGLEGRKEELITRFEQDANLTADDLGALIESRYVYFKSMLEQVACLLESGHIDPNQDVRDQGITRILRIGIRNAEPVILNEHRCVFREPIETLRSKDIRNMSQILHYFFKPINQDFENRGTLAVNSIIRMVNERWFEPRFVPIVES